MPITLRRLYEFMLLKLDFISVKNLCMKLENALRPGAVFSNLFDVAAAIVNLRRPP